jgi:hypothetical protein
MLERGDAVRQEIERTIIDVKTFSTKNWILFNMGQ